MGEVPRRMNPGTNPSGNPSSSHYCRAKWYSNAGIRSPLTPQEREEPTGMLAPAEVSTEEVAPTEEPTKELATLTAMISEPTEEPNTHPVQCEEKDKGEV